MSTDTSKRVGRFAWCGDQIFDVTLQVITNLIPPGTVFIRVISKRRDPHAPIMLELLSKLTEEVCFLRHLRLSLPVIPLFHVQELT
jgi:hypothetical protein